ncbi:hypothetical protein FACS1894120_1280 [Clostridia bacterium]|nr:hypothetical protein FACS1894120_1280 [Clostridia bacterium]
MLKVTGMPKIPTGAEAIGGLLRRYTPASDFGKQGLFTKTGSSLLRDKRFDTYDGSTKLPQPYGQSDKGGSLISKISDKYGTGKVQKQEDAEGIVRKKLLTQVVHSAKRLDEATLVLDSYKEMMSIAIDAKSYEVRRAANIQTRYNAEDYYAGLTGEMTDGKTTLKTDGRYDFSGRKAGDTVTLEEITKSREANASKVLSLLNRGDLSDSDNRKTLERFNELGATITALTGSHNRVLTAEEDSILSDRNKYAKTVTGSGADGGAAAYGDSLKLTDGDSGDFTGVGVAADYIGTAPNGLNRDNWQQESRLAIGELDKLYNDLHDLYEEFLKSLEHDKLEDAKDYIKPDEAIFVVGDTWMDKARAILDAEVEATSGVSSA